MIQYEGYKLTTAGEKLFKVLVDPEHTGNNVKELCETADVSRHTYYRLMNDKQFTELVSKTVRELIMNKAGDVLNATYKYSLEEKGHQDRKMLLNMAGLYTDKQEMNISGQIDIGAKADLIEKYLNDD